jgi:hypothetical protein
MEDIDPAPGVRVVLEAVKLALGGRAVGGAPGFDIDDVRFIPSATEARGRAVVLEPALDSGEETIERREDGFAVVDEDKDDFATFDDAGALGVGAREALRDGGGGAAEGVVFGGIEDLTGGCGPGAAFLTGEVTEVGFAGEVVAFDTVGFVVPGPNVPELRIYLTSQQVAKSGRVQVTDLLHGSGGFDSRDLDGTLRCYC